MYSEQVRIGQRVRSLRPFSGIPIGTEGVIDEDYGTGVMVAWDLPTRPLPQGYRAHAGESTIRTGILRDGFDKTSELQFLEIVTE